MGIKTKIKAALMEHGFVPQGCTYWSHFFRSGAIARRCDTSIRVSQINNDGTGSADDWRVEFLSPDGKSIEKIVPLRVWAREFGVVFP